ncbi:MAG: pyruvate kinase [Rhizobiales bacterium]|nr:pyruvate kinase [Hyphomicrobiales bacterium]
MKRSRKVKILATLGPASSEKQKIKSLYEAGADVFRINMSHTDHDRLRSLVAMIREIEAECGRPIGILADLQGPKLRIGTFAAKEIALSPGMVLVLDSDPTPGDQTRVYLPHPEIFAALEPGHRLLLDDGKVRLRVTERGEGSAITVVEVGTRLSDRKGVSLPDTTIGSGALTPKDRSDLEAALNAGVDWIAQSFVQRPEDMAEVKKAARGKAGVLAKIEKPQAVERLAAIVEQADALMVARGDLGVEMPLERVPGIQKQITRAARRAGKPVVVATQMLESMITAPVPTRAEVSDVATAVFEGADAVMLSAESASGAFPVEAVATMDRIAEEVERDPNYRNIMHAQRTEPEATGADAISAATRQIAETLNLAAICCYTASGATGMRAARERPQTPIIAFSPSVDTARRMALVWGLHVVVGEERGDLEAMIQHACDIAREEGFAKAGERIIVTAGVPLGTPGATNMLRIAFVPDQPSALA